jgi:hypothetical protein
MAHTCNSSYSGGRDPEDHGSRPAQAKKQDTILKIPSIKKDWWNGTGGRVPA